MGGVDQGLGRGQLQHDGGQDAPSALSRHDGDGGGKSTSGGVV